MKQSLAVQLDIQIPEHMILIEKVEYRELLDSKPKGKIWNMQDLVKFSGQSKDWLIDNLLQNPKFKHFLDVDNGGFVKYPGETRAYKIQASKMIDFIEREFPKIMMSM